jgi:TolB-like protein/tetratricopeptide (TPR) repeat protein
MNESTQGGRGAWLGWVGAVALALALGFVIMFVWGPEASDTEPESASGIEPVVAVLPLLDLAGTGDASLASGLVSELQAGLAMVRGLEVRGRLSSSAYTDVNRDAAHAGATVGARAVLDGTVQRTGGTLRVVLRLLDTRDRSTLWSQATESDLVDVFEWRDSVVARVGAALDRPVGPSVLRRLATRSTTLESFEHYSSARFQWAEGAGGDLVEALSEFDLALAADSGFAPTWAAMAHTYSELPRFTRFPAELVRSEGAAAARTALQLDPDGARAHAVLGQILYLYDYDFAAGRSHLERALELEAGNGETLIGLCELEMVSGRMVEAREACDEALAVDPHVFTAAWLDADLSKIEGDYDRSINSLDSLRALYPGYIPLAADVAFTRLLAGDTALGRRDLGYWVELLGGDSSLVAAFWGDDPTAALHELASELSPSASNLAALAALLGETEVGLSAVESAVALREPGATRFLVFPEYSQLRDTPGYESHMAEILSGQRYGEADDSS